MPSERTRQDGDAADRMMLRRIADDRDVAAMELMYNQYRPRLTSFLRRLSRDDGLIEEAYNEVMIKVWDKAHQYQGRSKVSSWIFTIAHRTCLRMVLKQQKREQLVELAGDDLPDVAVGPSGTGDVGAGADSMFDGAQMNAAIKKLPTKQRMVIELCYFEGYSTEEIGQIVGCPTNTVKTRLHHARKKIQTFLQQADQQLQPSLAIGASRTRGLQAEGVSND